MAELYFLTDFKYPNMRVAHYSKAHDINDEQDDTQYM